jgi:hypothetical protein
MGAVAVFENTYCVGAAITPQFISHLETCKNTMTATQTTETPRRSRLIPQIKRVTANGSLISMDSNSRKLRKLPNIKLSFEFHPDHGPALRSAIEEISNTVGGRLVGSHRYAKEQALTDACVVLGALRAAVNSVVPNADPNYI